MASPLPVGLQANCELTSSVPRGQIVPSVTRAIAILNLLARGPSTATLAGISKALAIPRSSALALCNTLVETGLLRRAGDGTYRLGSHTLELSRAFLAQTGLHSEFERAVHELGSVTDHTLVLSVLDGTDVVYVGRRNGGRAVGVSYELGMRLPAHCTASGKAMLCELEPDEVRRLYGDSGSALPALTHRSITAIPELLAELSRCRARGHATDDEETALGMACIGAAIRDNTSRVCGAVAVSLVKAALSADELTSTASEVVLLAEQISASLGAPPAVRARTTTYG
jgi:IclR family transcriptional regulator, blcABC operon repressor